MHWFPNYFLLEFKVIQLPRCMLISWGERFESGSWTHRDVTSNRFRTKGNFVGSDSSLFQGNPKSTLVKYDKIHSEQNLIRKR